MPAKREVVLEEFAFDAEGLAPREIAVQTEFTAVSPGTECANYLALDPDVYSPTGWCRYPWVPGYAGTGKVIGVGADVKEFKIGDGMVAHMPHASHCRLDIDGQVSLRNPNIAPEHAAFVRILAIATNEEVAIARASHALLASPERLPS